MKQLITLAFKNMARYKRRTFLTAFAVAIGIGMFIGMDAMLLGAEKESDRNIVTYETSSARIMNRDYWKNRDRLPLSLSMNNPEQILKILDANGIPSAPRTVFSADLVVRQDPFEEDGSMMVRVFAIDPKRDDNVFSFRNTVKYGTYLEPHDEGVLMGGWLAEDLGAEVGYPISLVTRTKEGFFQTIDTVITGILDCPNPNINRSSVFMTLYSADLHMQMEGSVTEINLSFPDRANLEEKTAFVRDILSGEGFDHEVMHWRSIASEYGALTEAKQMGTSIILLLLFIIAAVGITNTMLMAVYERISEIGMLRAMGMKDLHIRIIFMTEAAGIGLLGSIIGLVLGILLNLFMVNYGIDYTWMVREIDIGYRTAGRMYSAWNPDTMALAFLAGIVICFFVAWLPTRKALNMKITDCLRHS